jgi:hypothetical protein
MMHLRPETASMTIEQYAVLCMKRMGLQHEANYCVSTAEDARRLKQEIAEVEIVAA